MEVKTGIYKGTPINPNDDTNYAQMDATGRLIVKLCDCKKCKNKLPLRELLDQGYRVIIEK